MSLLIKGMEMPKENPRTINIYRDGTWVDAYTTEDGRAIEMPILSCEGGNMMNIVEWANEGLQIAEESGKSVDDLCTFLRTAHAMKTLFFGVGSMEKEYK